MPRAHVAWLVALALGLAAARVCAADDPVAATDDCNTNGIADSTDIATGVADDLDRDGVIDDCAAPVDLDTFTPGALLRPDARDARVQHLLVRYRYRAALEIVYASRGAATLDGVTVLVKGGRPWRSVSHLEGAGAHVVVVPTERLGLPSDAHGTGLVRLQLGKKLYTMPVAWDWRGAPSR